MASEGKTGNGRLAYVDALRGFTMFLVVFNHVIFLSFGTDGREVTSAFFGLFRMPMFFFISGFVGYKALEHWTAGFYARRVRQKLVVQIIPALFFFTLYTLCHGGNPLDALHVGFGGYWFTFVLLEMLLTYFTLSLLARHTHNRVLDVGLVLLALGLGYLSVGNRNDTALEHMLSLESFLFFFQFFAMGVLCRRYYGQLMRLLSNRWVSAAVMLAFIALCMTQLNDTCRTEGRVDLVLHLACRVMGVLTLFNFFAQRESYFSANGRAQRALTYVGRRTLDIYLLHFFFLPDLSHHASWILPENQVLAQVSIGGAIAVAIIALCLLCSLVLRTSDVLAHYLLGVKTNKTENHSLKN